MRSETGRIKNGAHPLCSSILSQLRDMSYEEGNRWFCSEAPEPSQVRLDAGREIYLSQSHPIADVVYPYDSMCKDFNKDCPAHKPGQCDIKHYSYLGNGMEYMPGNPRLESGENSPSTLQEDSWESDEPTSSLEDSTSLS
jgi:hypothetical protein